MFLEKESFFLNYFSLLNFAFRKGVPRISPLSPTLSSSFVPPLVASAFSFGPQKKLQKSSHPQKKTHTNMFASSQHLVQHQRFSSALASTSRARNGTSNKRVTSPRANAVAVVGAFIFILRSFSLPYVLCARFGILSFMMMMRVIRESDVLRVSRSFSFLSPTRAIFSLSRARGERESFL